MVQWRETTGSNVLLGDEDEQDRLQLLCDNFRPDKAWPARKHDLNSIVFKRKTVPSPKLSNPGQGQPGCWQLGESVEEFVKRLPPVTTSALLHEWIWVHNPYPQSQNKSEVANVGDFTTRGQELLARSLQTRKDIEAHDLHKNSSVTTRRLNEESKLLQQRITDLAADTNLLFGKVSV